MRWKSFFDQAPIIKTDDHSPLTDGFYGTVSLADGEAYAFGCPRGLADQSQPPEASFYCQQSDDDYDGILLMGWKTPEVVAATVASADDSYVFAGDVEMDITAYTPNCGGPYRNGAATIILQRH